MWQCPSKSLNLYIKVRKDVNNVCEIKMNYSLDEYTQYWKRSHKMCVILKLSILECEVNQDNTFFLQWVHYILERTFVDDFSFDMNHFVYMKVVERKREKIEDSSLQ